MTIYHVIQLNLSSQEIYLKNQPGDEREKTLPLPYIIILHFAAYYHLLKRDN